MEKSSVFLVDDHQIMLDGLAMIIADMPQLELAGTAQDGQEAIQRIPALSPDLVIMDLDMPILNGLEAARILLTDQPEIKIIILSMYAEPAMVKRMMPMGISGYLVKNTDQDELKLAIRQVLKGKRYFQPDVLDNFVSGKSLQTSSEEVKQLSLLSDRELDVLKGIASGQTSAEIGTSLFISPRTVETHRRNIHQKLGIKHMAGLIRFAIKAGLIS